MPVLLIPAVAGPAASACCPALLAPLKNNACGRSFPQTACSGSLLRAQELSLVTLPQAFVRRLHQPPLIHSPPESLLLQDMCRMTRPPTLISLLLAAEAVAWHVPSKLQVLYPLTPSTSFPNHSKHHPSPRPARRLPRFRGPFSPGACCVPFMRADVF